MAFDLIHRPLMWKILELYGIPTEVIWILTRLYEGSESYVGVGIEHADRVSVDSGVIPVTSFIQHSARFCPIKAPNDRWWYRKGGWQTCQGPEQC